MKLTNNQDFAIETFLNTEGKINRRRRKDVKVTNDHDYPFVAQVRDNDISLTKNSIKVQVRHAHHHADTAEHRRNDLRARQTVLDKKNLGPKPILGKDTRKTTKGSFGADA